MSNISEEKVSQNGGCCFSRHYYCSQYYLGMSHGHISPTRQTESCSRGYWWYGTCQYYHVKGTENIVALCDVDWKYAKGVFDEFPQG